MRDDKKLVVGDPPKEYDYKKFSDILNRIEVFANSIMAAGPARLSAIDTTGMPTSGTGLRDNAVYNHNGVLVVQPATGVDADTLGGHDPSYYGAALGYTPVNKAGDTMTGGLAFGSAVASGATDVTRHIALYGTAYGFSITGGTLNYVSGGANHDFYTTTNTFVGRISSSGLLLGNTTGGSPGAGKVNAVDYQINGTSISSLYVATTDYTAADVLTKIKTVDGSGSGLDADTLDGHDTAYFQTALGYTPANVAGDTFTGAVNFDANLNFSTPGSDGQRIVWTDSTNNTSVFAGLYFEQLRIFGIYRGGGAAVICYLDPQTGKILLTGDPTAALGAATKQYVDALPLAKSYESAQQTITSGGALSLSHGLGAQPKLYQAFLICTTADGGYAVGDEVVTNPSISAVNTNSRGISLVPTSTTIGVRFGSEVQSISLIRKDTGAQFQITNSSWKLVVRAWL